MCCRINCASDCTPAADNAGLTANSPRRPPNWNTPLPNVSTAASVGGSVKVEPFHLPSTLEQRSDRQWLPVAGPSGGVALAAVQRAATGSPTLILSTASISSAFFGSVGLQIGNLDVGESVRLERFQVNTTNGTVDAAAILQQSLLLTDGQQGLIGGVPNINLIADLTPADGAITAQVDFFTGFVPQMIGDYVFRISSPSNRFAPVSARFTVTPHSYSQSVAGKVLANGAGLAHAYVVLLDLANPGANFVTGAVADAAGNYVIPAPPGDYLLAAARPGHGIRFYYETLVKLPAGASANVNANVTSGTHHIRGRLANRNNPGQSLPGVQLILLGDVGEGEPSELSFAYTDAEGNYDAAVSEGVWQVYVLDDAVAQIGFVGLLDAVEVDVLDGDAEGVDLLLPPVEAIFHGHATGTGGTPLAGVEMLGFTEDFDFAAYGVTDATGFYAVGVSAEPWRLEPAAASLAQLGYTGMRSFDTSPAAGQAVRQDFDATAATAFLNVQVTDELDEPLPYVGVRVYERGGEDSVVVENTDDFGDLRAALHAGTFLVETDPLSLGGLIEARPPDVTLQDGDDLDVTVTLVEPTQYVNIQVVDQNGEPVPLLPLYLGATLGGQTFRSCEFTGWDGFASLPALPGEWTLLLNESGFFAPESYGFLTTTNRVVQVGLGDVDYELELTSTLIARDDSLRATRGQPVTLRFVDLLGNDSTIPGGQLDLFYVDELSLEGGEITFGSDSLTYLPPSSGSADSFDYLVADEFGNYALATVDVVIIEATTPKLTVIGTRVEGADVVTRFAGAPGASYRIQSSASLGSAAWENSALLTADSNGQFEFRDVAPGGPVRFYRAVTP